MPFFITPAADAFLQQLSEDAGASLTFRIRANPEAAGGQRIQIDLEEPPQVGEKDVSLQAQGYRVIIDQASMDFLDDYHMDYDDSGPQPAFAFHHSHG